MNDPDRGPADEVASARARDQGSVPDSVLTLGQRRRKAILETAGSLSGIWKPGDLDRLRDEWDRSRPN